MLFSIPRLPGLRELELPILKINLHKTFPVNRTYHGVEKIGDRNPLTQKSLMIKLTPMTLTSPQPIDSCVDLIVRFFAVVEKVDNSEFSISKNLC